MNAQMKRDRVPREASKAITGHLSDKMYEHYGDVTLDQKAEAVGEFVGKVVPFPGSSAPKGGNLNDSRCL